MNKRRTAIASFSVMVALSGALVASPAFAVGGGFGGNGPYLYLDTSDQQVVQSGDKGELDRRICDFNGFACNSKDDIWSAASNFISQNGICPNDQSLYMYQFDSSLKCES